MPVDFQEEAPAKIDFQEEAESPFSVVPESPASTPEELTGQEFYSRKARGVPVMSGPPTTGLTESPFKVLEELKAKPTSEVPPTSFETALAAMQPGGLMMGANVPVEVGRRARNLAISLPQFATSPVGAASAVVGAIVPTLVAAGFTLDTLRGMVKEVPKLWKEWPQMSNEERAGALTDVLGQAGMAALLARSTAKGVREMIPKKPPVIPPPEAPATPPVIPPPESPPAAPAPLAAAKESPAAASAEMKTGVAEALSEAKAAPEKAGDEAKAAADKAIADATPLLPEAAKEAEAGTTKGAPDDQGIRSDTGLPPKEGQVVEGVKEDSGNDVEQAPPVQPEPVVEGGTPTPPPPPEGPGAATPAGVGAARSQIEQLSDAFQNKAPAKDRAAEMVRQSFDFGQRAAQAQDAVSRAIGGLKATGEVLWKSLTKFDKPDDLLKAKGVLSAELETRGWRVRQFAKDVKQAMPDARRRAAISKWIEADGDTARLATGEAQTKPEFKQAYRDAQNLTPEEKIAAQNVSNYFDARLQEAIDAGVLEHGLDDYIHRIYQRDPALMQRALAYVQSGILAKNPALAKKRMFQFDWEAERSGLRPVQDFLPRVTDYETSLSKAIAARAFIKRMTELTAPDGRPVIGIKGVGVPIEDAAGVRTGTLIKPLGDFKKANDPADALHYRGDYVNKEYNALSKWKWVGTDTDGKPIFLKGDVAIHPAFVGRIAALLEPSHVRYGRYPRLGQALLGVGSTVKQTMLDLSMFHQVQIAVHAAEHRVMPWNIVKDIDFNDPKVDSLLKGGLTLGGDYHASNFGEGLVGHSISRNIPLLGPVMESYHSWLFQDFIPRVKMSMATHALDRNRASYAKDLAAGRMTEADLNFMTAKQANAAFGELNYTMLERSKTTQDLARLMFLAPDFLEARAKFVGQALNLKYGREQQAALFLGALTLYATARVMNKLIDGQFHNELENLFGVVYKNNTYSLRTVQGDVLHMLTKPVTFWLYRLNPVYSRTLMELATQRDQFGRKRDIWQILGDSVSNVTPISLRSSRERHLWESVMNGLGITARRWNDVETAHELAASWKKKNGVREPPGEFVYDSDKDPLRPLKIALSEQDDAGAVKEIASVLKSKKMTLPKMNEYFARYAHSDFTGSTHANEAKFIASLTEDQKKTIEGARQHRAAMLKLYYSARKKYTDALNSPAP